MREVDGVLAEGAAASGDCAVRTEGDEARGAAAFALAFAGLGPALPRLSGDAPTECAPRESSGLSLRLVALPPLGESVPPPVYAAAARDGEGEQCDSSRAELDGGFDGGRKPMEYSMAGPFEASIRDSSMAKRSAACAAIIISAPLLSPVGRESGAPHRQGVPPRVHSPRPLPPGSWLAGGRLARGAKTGNHGKI